MPQQPLSQVPMDATWEWEEAGAFDNPPAADGCRSCTVQQDGLDMKVTG